MIKEEVKNKIKEALNKMSCSSIEFVNGDPGKVMVKFDCETLISFKVELKEWSYSGIQINDLGEQKYKIEFKRSEEYIKS